MKFLRGLLFAVLLCAGSVCSDAVAQPVLHIARQGTNVIVSWPGTSPTNFVLQQTPALAGLSLWSNLAQPAASNAGYYSIQVSASSNAAYFRLLDSGTNLLDEPDDSFTDSNGDGIDGDVARAIFVDGTGDDSNAGTATQPVKTVSEGIRRAALAGKQVYVAGGLYASGTVHLTNGVAVYGGYKPGDWTFRSAAFVPEIVVSNPVAIRADGITLTTRLDHLKIRVTDQSNASQSAYGVLATGSSGLVIRRCTIDAGRGGNGIAGMAGAVGTNGLIGGTGQPGCEDSSFPCDSCLRPAGGLGGTSACERTGGVGGMPGRSAQGGQNGGQGAGGTPGGAGAAGESAHGVPGDPGAQGLPGTPGTAGGGAFTALGFVPVAGGNGLTGSPGNGGGGGGGGGGGTTDCDSYGSSGGGGGGGGCGGFPGEGGRSGGGSIAIYLWASSASVSFCDIKTAGGGNGGSGGGGGSGGQGGPGGPGGPYGGSSEQDDGGNGAAGGMGGSGGAGGPGGGGAGGPSIGILAGGGSAPQLQANIFTISGGGTGGSSAGNPGPAGMSVSTFSP